MLHLCSSSQWHTQVFTEEGLGVAISHVGILVAASSAERALEGLDRSPTYQLGDLEGYVNSPSVDAPTANDFYAC